MALHGFWVTFGRVLGGIAYSSPTLRPRFSKEYAFLTPAYDLSGRLEDRFIFRSRYTLV